MLACTALVGCTNEDVIDNPNEKPDNGKTNAYMAIRLVNADGSASRATDSNDDGYINGSADENEVKTATFYFYDANGSPIETTGAHEINYVTLSTSWHVQGEGNVEKISDAVITLKDKTYEDAKKFKYVIAVLNEATPGQSNWVNKTDMETKFEVTSANNTYFNLFPQTSETEKTHIMNKDGNFTMSNSTYMNAEKKAVAATAIEEGNILMQEPDEDELNYDNAVTIYVERLAAKVEVTTGSKDGVAALDKDNCITLTSEIDTYDEQTNKVVTSQEYSIKIKVNGWGLNGTAKNSYIIKKINGETGNDAVAFTDDNLFTNWNDATLFRSFWAKSTNYGKDLTYPENFASQAENAANKGTESAKDADDAPLNYISWSELGNNFGTFDYCAENTNNKAILEKGQFFSAVTSVLVKAQVEEIALDGKVLKDASDNNVKTLVRYSSGLYTMDAYKARVYNEVNIKVYDITKDGEGNVTTTTDVDWRQWLTVKDMHDGNITLELEVPETVSTDNWYSDKKGENAVTVTNISDKLSNLTMVNNNPVGPLAECYNDGMMYYNIPIKHLKEGKYTEPTHTPKVDENGNVTGYESKKLSVEEAQYGVVRNHWYDVKITEIKNMGEAVYNKYEDIIIDTNETEKWYIGTAINILSWRIVDQDVQL